MNAIRAAAVQFNHRPGDKDANIETVKYFIAKAAAQQVDLLCFPEMCITGYWHVRNLSRAAIEALAEPVPDGPSVQFLLERSRTTGISIGAGLIEQGEDGRLFNSYIVAMPDGRYACHRKLHCFISEHMDSGDSYTVFDTPQGCRVGVLICYDNNILENARLTALQGAEVLMAPHQTGGCRSRSPHSMQAIDPQLWQNRHRDDKAMRTIRRECQGPKGRAWLMRWLPARAHDNGLFLLFSNGIGIDDDEVRTGNAMILDPYGEVLTETDSIEDAMVVADLDPELRATSTGARWLKARRPELYGALAQETGKERGIREVRFGPA
jgi:N-carbamoylputrescine amidase